MKREPSQVGRTRGPSRVFRLFLVVSVIGLAALVGREWRTANERRVAKWVLGWSRSAGTWQETTGRETEVPTLADLQAAGARLSGPVSEVAAAIDQSPVGPPVSGYRFLLQRGGDRPGEFAVVAFPERYGLTGRLSFQVGFSWQSNGAGWEGLVLDARQADLRGKRPSERLPSRQPPSLASAGPGTTVVRQGATFSLAVFKESAARTDGNFVLIGPSLLHVLAALRAGAGGTTADALDAVLGAGEGPSPGLSEVVALGASLQRAAAAGGGELRLRQAAWVQAGAGLEEAWLSRVEGRGLEVREVDFERDPSGALREIDRWLGGSAKPGPAGLRGQRLLLIQSGSFSATWADRFDRSDTEKRDFHLASGEPVRVPTMALQADLPFAQEEGLSVLALPYADSTLALLVVLPEQGTDLATVVGDLDVASVERWLSRLEVSQVHLLLPKFAFRSRLELRPAVEALGLAEMFRAGAPDFRAISASPLHLSELTQEASIEVDEEGTRIAWATLAGMQNGHRNFTVDRPFAFLVVDRHSGAVLAVGRVADPR